MFKKLKLISIILIFPIFLISCKTNFIETMKISLKISKPSLNFYTKSLINSINNSDNIHISIFYTKTGKNKVIPPEHMDKFNLFINSIKPNYFLDPSTVDSNNIKNIEYKLTVFINDKSSFVINIFSDKFISIHPWDGNYEPDIIYISDLQDGINIYNVIDFIIKNNIEK